MIVSLYLDNIATIVVYGGVLLSMAGDVMHTGCRCPALAGRIPVPYWATLEVGSPPVFPLQLQERDDHLSRTARNKVPLGQSAALLGSGYEPIEQACGGPRFGKAFGGGARGDTIATRDTRRDREERRMIRAAG